jgi:hypothetical protein
MTTITKTQDPIFGNLVCITNGAVELKVAVDYGPRVLHCACVGMENMFFQDPSKGVLGEKFDVYEGDQQILYGGHRLWISPEIMPRCYHPDNHPVAVEEIENGARFTAAVEKYNGIQKSMSITLAPDAPRVKVVHTIRNVGLWEKIFAPWAITMLAAGGTEVMPQVNRATVLLPNRSISLWDYAEMDDSRITWGKSYIVLQQDATKKNPFKLGYNNEAGWAAYFNKGQVFLKYFEPTVDGVYPDNGCCFESYTNAGMLEMETLGELMELEPDEFTTLEEEWELYPTPTPDLGDEVKIKQTMAQWVK